MTHPFVLMTYLLNDTIIFIYKKKLDCVTSGALRVKLN